VQPLNGDPETVEDSSLELSSQVRLQLGGELTFGEGRLRLLCSGGKLHVSMLLDDGSAVGSVELDEWSHEILARWMAELGNHPSSGETS
jgi:hypothetical protein